MIYRAVKRMFDCAVAASALTATAPITVPTAIAIRATMGSPILFRQKRPGKNGDAFEILKFRTMRDLKPGETLIESDAARITKLGAFLRQTSLDEFPTFLNVLKGDMSVVGPRPLLVRYLDRYSSEQARRHNVKPGITGWAQVNGRNAISWDEKFRLDVWYVDNASLKIDAMIVMKTALKVLKRDGISSAGHATMPEFMGSEV